MQKIPGFKKFLSILICIAGSSVQCTNSDSTKHPKLVDLNEEFQANHTTSHLDPAMQDASSGIPLDIFKGEWLYTATVVASHSDAEFVSEGQMVSSSSRLTFDVTKNYLRVLKVREEANSGSVSTEAMRFPAEMVANDGSSDKNLLQVAFTRNKIPQFFNDVLVIGKFFKLIKTSESLLFESPTFTNGLISYKTQETYVPNAHEGYYGTGDTLLEPVSLVVRHNFVRVDNRTYRPVDYSNQEFAKFGFFKVKRYFRDQKKGATDDAVKTYLTRYDFSHDRKMYYYLSKDCPKEYQPAYKAISQWNDVFKEAIGREALEIRENSGQEVGDPRFNLIHCVKNPGAFAVAYGPSLVDPVTGEIISANSVLYLDAYRSRRVKAGEYYDLYHARRNGSTEEFVSEGSDPHFTVGLNPALKSRLAKKAAQQDEMSETVQWDSNLRRQSLRKVEKSHLSFQKGSTKVSSLSSFLTKMQKSDDTQVSEIFDQKLIQPLTQSLKSLSAVDALADHDVKNHECHHQAHGYVSAATGFIEAHADMEKEELLDVFDHLYQTSTLAHEIGHNLGLRHQFKGSFDEHNFPAAYHQMKRDLKNGDMSIEDFKRFRFSYMSSSRMDYMPLFSFANPSAMGSYDVAAIKFGYARVFEVVTKADEFTGEVIEQKHIKVGDYRKLLKEFSKSSKALEIPEHKRIEAFDDALKIRKYAFCSDYEVVSDVTCNRHDVGTSLDEIIASQTENFDNRYLMSAFRRNRRFFDRYPYHNIQMILGMRQILDEFFYRKIHNNFAPQGQPESEEDFIRAIDRVFGFYMKVLGTVSPGSYALNSETGLFEKLSFDDEQREDIFKVDVPLGEGKFLFGRVQPDGLEQKLVRQGTEIDKIAVLYALSSRSLPIDRYQEARIDFGFYDLPVFKDTLLKIFGSVVSGHLVMQFRFLKNDDGDVKVVSQQEFMENQKSPDYFVGRVEPEMSQAVTVYGMLFAFMGLNSIDDLTFEDYISMNIVDQSWPQRPNRSELPVASFSSVNGHRKYLVPQTRDGAHFTYPLAELAADAEQVLKLQRKFSEQSPEIVGKQALKIFSKIFQRVADRKLSRKEKKLMAEDTEKLLSAFSLLSHLLVAQLIEDSPTVNRDGMLDDVRATWEKEGQVGKVYLEFLDGIDKLEPVMTAEQFRNQQFPQPWDSVLKEMISFNENIRMQLEEENGFFGPHDVIHDVERRLLAIKFVWDLLRP